MQEIAASSGAQMLPLIVGALEDKSDEADAPIDGAIVEGEATAPDETTLKTAT